MTGDEIRSAFLGFFEEKGHKIVPSSSLIPHGDPTLLLTSAGMVQFKPYFLGEEQPPNPRLTSCQKCFRTTDIEAVGDPHHLTFFEMLGNFSIGNYFKREAIAWAWEFITRYLSLPLSRLWITIYLDDDESFAYWKDVGVPAERILRYGEEHNFWGPAGNSGPCGPSSEIHYDMGKEVGCQRADCAPGCDCGRFSEIWNLVFTQYNQDEKGNRTPLPAPNIDTGMGLERTAAIMQDKTNVYETDLFLPLLNRISRLTGKDYSASSETGQAMRIVAEHGRGISFLVADGVLPGNEGRGYVLRRLLRRGALFSRRLSEDTPLLAEVARATIQQMGHIYPEIVEKEDFIIRVIESEEARFSQTLNNGLNLLDGLTAEALDKGDKQISGVEVFRLYDTYGFPKELTTEILARSGLSVDTAAFDEEMSRQQERARSVKRFRNKADGRTGEQLDITNTCFIGYSGLSCTASVASVLVEDKLVESAQKGQKASIILDTTSFYAEKGGQVGDTGEIVGPGGKFRVTNTITGPRNVTIHEGKVFEGTINTGDGITAKVDRERRLDIARNHTATHLLQLALRRVLGEHVQQRGSLVAPDRLRFDFSHLEALNDKELKQVSQAVNDLIRQNLPVCGQESAYQQAIDEGAIALFDEKYGDEVRVVKIGEEVVSAELCGGTHVAATGEIGFFQIIHESSIGASLRRIEAVTGRGAEEMAEEQAADIHELASTLGVAPHGVKKKISALVNELASERQRAILMERELSKTEITSLLKKVEEINGVAVLAARVPAYRLDRLREISDSLREQLKSVVLVLGTLTDDKPMFLAAVTPDLVDKGYHAGKIVNQVALVAGGRGGGKAQFAQAGGRDKSKLDEALNLVKKLV